MKQDIQPAINRRDNIQNNLYTIEQNGENTTKSNSNARKID